MIEFERFELSNGMRVLAHEDPSTPLVAVNIMYDVGSRDENPERTGLAHLFEHLMFSGSVNIPEYDREIQKVGGENNAFTGNDITNYYCTLPAENIETAFWLESDRMLGLDLSERNLEIQRQVVIEEFRQRYLNQPYGDVWLLLRPEAYQVHPYRWPTIGKNEQHIREITADDVKAFFYRYYAPNNAVMSVVGNIAPKRVRQLAEKWFAPIERHEIQPRNLPQEPEHTEAGMLTVTRQVPVDAIYKVFHMDGLYSRGFYCGDILSDVLASGKSSRLYQRLLKGKQLFSEINAYITGDADPGLFVVYGKPMPEVTLEKADDAIKEELEKLSETKLSSEEMQKQKNKFESSFIFNHTNILNKAIHLCRHELIDGAENLNREIEIYSSITANELHDYARKIFNPANSATLYYCKSGD